jgi:hypothetical protein
MVMDVILRVKPTFASVTPRGRKGSPLMVTYDEQSMYLYSVSAANADVG